MIRCLTAGVNLLYETSDVIILVKENASSAGKITSVNVVRVSSIIITLQSWRP